MADINNRNQFRAWLGMHPREMAVALAARAALRVLPVVQTAKGYTGGPHALPVFRATVISWGAAKYPAHETEFVAAYAYAEDAAYAGSAAAPFFWSALSADATRLEEGAAASDVARMPLWPESQPDHLRSLWQELEAGLLAAEQDWQVWTIWYDDRLDGHAREEERELAYVRIDEALWNQGPAIVNAEIKRRIDERAPAGGAKARSCSNRATEAKRVT